MAAKKKKVLVCGGAGYIGGYLTDLLSLQGYDVTVYDNLLYEARYLKDTKFVFGDVRDTEVLGRILNGFDVIVWLAALVGDVACVINPSITRAVNVASVRWLAGHYKGKIIFASTCSVYGINNDILDESAPVNPLSLYAKTKVQAERIIGKAVSARKRLVLRFGTLFGAGDTYARSRFDLVVNAWIVKAALGEPLRVFGGGQWRPLLHVKDAAHAISHALSENLCGLYNVSYQNFLMKDVAEEIKKVCSGKEVKVEYLNVKFGDVRDYRVSSEKFRRLGWRPRYGLADGIREIYQMIAEGRIRNVSDPVYSNEAFLKSKLI